MNNKLDAFNEDKVKCKKCREYYDLSSSLLCEDCVIKWNQYFKQHWDGWYEFRKSNLDYLDQDAFFKDFLNEQQT